MKFVCLRIQIRLYSTKRYKKQHRSGNIVTSITLMQLVAGTFTYQKISDPSTLARVVIRKVEPSKYWERELRAQFPSKI